LFLREDLSFIECATFKQEHLILSLDDLIVFVTLGDSIPKTARCHPGAPKECGESQKVCIALLFVGIDSEHRVGLGGNLGGLGLKETRLFMRSSSSSRPIYFSLV
jgi:hypothetical protein